MSLRKCIGRLIFVSSSAIAIHATAISQCLDWKPGFFTAGTNNITDSFAAFDDGTGPALYVGGLFSSAGGTHASAIAKHTASAWSALGSGLTGAGGFPLVRAMLSFDDGTGPALYVAGRFDTAGGVPASNIAKWNGSTWAALGGGINNDVLSLAVFDDGSGPALFAGGLFDRADGLPASRIAKWNGSTWLPLGSGMSSVPAWTNVDAMIVFDDGSGPALYAGGTFAQAGGVPARNIARWDGSAWSPVGTGVGTGTDEGVWALSVFDAGGGPELYAGGSFSSAGGAPAARVAKWDGTAWSPLGSGINGSVSAFAVFDDGSGPALCASGSFSIAGGVSANSVARWNGSSWSSLGDGFDNSTILFTFDDGNGAVLYAGGAFNYSGTKSIDYVARWTGSSWSNVAPIGQGMYRIPHAFATYDDGTGRALYASNDIGQPGGVTCNGVAKWNGTSWSPLGSGLSGANQALAMLEWNDGSGSALYVAGQFTGAGGIPAMNIARWNGSSWSPLGSGLGNAGSFVFSLAAYDDGGGPALYAGGSFNVSGATPIYGIAKWNGSNWSPVGGGIQSSPGVPGSVNALCVYDGGGGPELVAGGAFHYAGGAPIEHIAKWNGSTWSSLGHGLVLAGGDFVATLVVGDVGSGPSLFVGGLFLPIDAFSPKVARWNGSVWSSLGGGADKEVLALTMFDDGGGSKLYAGGLFHTIGGVSVKELASWNGSSWSSVGGGVSGYSNGFVESLCVFDDGMGGGPDLYVGGLFGLAGSTVAANIAQWRGCAGPGTAYCFGDATAAACPCNNTGQPGHGCENSAATGGALLASAGTTNPDTVVLASLHELPNALSIFLQGNATIAPVAFGDGLRCAGGMLKRLYVKNASGGVVFAPAAGDPPITVRSAALGDPIAPGSLRYYQTYYRDPNQVFCPMPQGNTWNVTNGVRIQW